MAVELKKKEELNVQKPFLSESKTFEERVPVLCSQRWILAYLFFFGYFFAYALRVNISVAIVCMVRTPISNDTVSLDLRNNGTSDDQCGSLEDTIAANERAEFDWSKEEKSSLLSSFFYGYAVTQIPGGWLADRFGGRRVYGTAMAVAGIATLLIPVCARTNIALVYTLRIICGLATGTCFPSGQSMWGRWAPPLERTKLVSTGQVGAWMGTVVTFATSGVLCDYGFDNGWGSIFYITGGLTCIWVVIWFYQIRDNPKEHPRISEAEANHIVANVEYDVGKRTAKVPWRDMIKSAPLWAIICAHTFGNWGTYTLLTSLPEFMKNVLKFDIQSNGALSAVPYLCSAFMALTSAQIADLLRSRAILTTTQTRRLFQGIAHIGAGVFLLATGFVTCEHRYLAVLFLCLALLCLGFTRGGYAVNHIDIAPKYGGFLYGVTNTCATIPGVVAPIAVAALTQNDIAVEWRNVFYVSAAFYFCGATVFGCLARGEIQYWALDDNDKEKAIEITSPESKSD